MRNEKNQDNSVLQQQQAEISGGPVTLKPKYGNLLPTGLSGHRIPRPVVFKPVFCDRDTLEKMFSNDEPDQSNQQSTKADSNTPPNNGQPYASPTKKSN